MKIRDGSEVSVIAAPEDSYALYIDMKNKKEKWISRIVAFKVVISDVGEHNDGLVQLVPICQGFIGSYLEDDDSDQIEYIGTHEECREQKKNGGYARARQKNTGEKQANRGSN